jgi:hypothetical protein
MKDISLYESSRIFAIIRYIYLSVLLVIASIYTVNRDVSFHLVLFMPTIIVCLLGVWSVVKNWVTVEKTVCKILLTIIALAIISNAYLLIRLHLFTAVTLLIIEVGCFSTILNRLLNVEYLIKEAKKFERYGIK